MSAPWQSMSGCAPCARSSCPFSPPPCPCPQPGGCCAVAVPGPTGPPGAFTPTSFFQAAVSTSSAAGAALAAVPFNLALVGNDDGAFSPLTGLYTAPALGAYRFDCTVTLALTGAGAFVTTVVFFVQGTPPVLQSQLSGIFQGGGTQSLSGSTLLQLLPGQQVGVACAVTPPPGGVASIAGPASPLSPPYPSVFSATSLF